MMVSIARENPDQPAVRRLLELSDARSATLYPSQSRFGVGLDALLAPGVCFLVARIDGEAAGCGGFAPGENMVAELKRIFVVETARGRGIARKLIAALEVEARRVGVRRMRLETGVKSIEAISLYGKLGYVGCARFGDYPDDPRSIFMEKRLPVTPFPAGSSQ